MNEWAYMDFHVAGEPFRVITSGVPEIRGRTMEEKRQYAAAYLDDIRKIALLEPRGHDDMYGGFLTPPVVSGSDVGVVFLHGTGMSTMCGHGAIATARAAIELGIVKPESEQSTVMLDTPAGTVRLSVQMENGGVGEIRLRNDLTFPVMLSAPVKTPSYGTVTVDVGYGGAFMVFADIHQFGISMEAENIPIMVDAAMECGRCAIQQIQMVHPKDSSRNAKANGICMILMEEEAGTGDVQTRTFTVFGKRQFDRSPTGTGTSALAAILHAKGKLPLGKRLINCGITGIPFVVEIQKEGNGILPTICSRAYLTGRGTILLEDGDPLQTGFSIRYGVTEEI